MKYLRILRNRRFASMWLGMTVSALGDGMSWVALLWIIIKSSDSPAAVAPLVIAYTAPVVVGGLAAGIILDRFSPVKVLFADSLIRGVAFAAIPVLYWSGHLDSWMVYVIASIYGLMKMFSLAGVPSLIPDLVDPDDISTANALESLSFDIGAIVGPPLSGLLIGVIGSGSVVGIDALTYFFFAGALLVAGRGLQHNSSRRDSEPDLGFVQACKVLFTIPAITTITLMFMAFNVGGGMFDVTLPIFTKRMLGAGPVVYGELVGALAVGGIVSSLIVGARETPGAVGRAIAFSQILAGLSYLGLATAQFGWAMIAVAAAGFFASPLTIWAQTIRMRLIPPQIRGRSFAVLRTFMQATPPLGGALGGILLSHASVRETIAVISFLIAIPGLVGLLHPSLGRRFMLLAPVQSARVLNVS